MAIQEDLAKFGLAIATTPHGQALMLGGVKTVAATALTATGAVLSSPVTIPLALTAAAAWTVYKLVEDE